MNGNAYRPRDVAHNPATVRLLMRVASRPAWARRIGCQRASRSRFGENASRDIRCWAAPYRQSDATRRIRRQTMCRVLNKHHVGIPAGAVYIGRGSKWGNPFRIGQDSDRAAVIAKHVRWLADQHHLLRVLDELRGRDLVCFCAPRACHGDLLARLANATREERIAWWRAVKAAA
ncbi:MULTISPECIES: DUF4326 domain-containing protein [Bradyrhizobium]|jgi:hypothetical protein|nr:MULTISPECIES: DUF4326 domain-containing protein [Bradyrhizobium]MDU1497893.1 DUF4326 domain-containing protein [Bradyrhizobium sp.]MDU1548156.1 DUF4326 domain-containing protein [Bradyrhizobium sp.]MDU1694804.1 DUF4326 domain-containing protein [Bradyrhizobium sp.]MDU1805564.1 DUF4326 domain-containing protein [Bradyrhizobium sp.]MDU2923411.1 DUF4326 domain-containing protein [Bradyrhizobium sp.]